MKSEYEKQASIFDLEQAIMNCWNVVDDIDMLYKHFGDNPKFTGLEAKSEDEMMNLMLGLKSLYQLKFEGLWSEFEAVCREFHKRGNALQNLDAKVPDRL